ncbi:MAG TPA: alpha/beta hydrolase [Pseudonocardiaceae bacterium]
MKQLLRRPVTSGTGRVAAVLAVVIGLFLAMVFSGSAASGRTTAATTHAAVKPTIVFVHGGWADSSGWNGEISRLEQAGYPVIAPANPLRGLASDADYVRSVLQTISGPIVLVGHSYGGAVISNAARGVPNVRALVYIAAFAPDTGESLQTLVNKNPGTMIVPANLDARQYPLPGGGDGTDLYIKKAAFHDAFAGDLPLSTTNLMWAEQRPFSAAAFGEPSGDPAWKTVPSWYLLSTNDHAIPPATQWFMARRAHAHIETVAASHVPMISHPQVTTDVILDAARSVS